MRIVWDQDKRQSNWAKHGLDFIDSMWVLDSPYRFDVVSSRSLEHRTQSFAYAFKVLAVLTVVYVSREDAIRIISFRPASEEERSVYHEWLENEFHDD